jgi:hypothetical protein
MVLNTVEAADRAGVTVRQLDYWLGLGLFHIPAQKPGSGRRIEWHDVDVAAAQAIGAFMGSARRPSSPILPLMIEGIYRWWNRAEFVVATTTSVAPANSPEEVVQLHEGHYLTAVWSLRTAPR